MRRFHQQRARQPVALLGDRTQLLGNRVTSPMVSRVPRPRAAVVSERDRFGVPRSLRFLQGAGACAIDAAGLGIRVSLYTSFSNP